MRRRFDVGVGDGMFGVTSEAVRLFVFAHFRPVSKGEMTVPIGSFTASDKLPCLRC